MKAGCGAGNHKATAETQASNGDPGCYSAGPTGMGRGRVYWNLGGQKEFVCRASYSDLAGDTARLRWPHWEGFSRRNTWVFSLLSPAGAPYWLNSMTGQRAQDSYPRGQPPSIGFGWSSGRYGRELPVQRMAQKRWRCSRQWHEVGWFGVCLMCRNSELALPNVKWQAWTTIFFI